MDIRKMALALPLAFGIGCATSDNRTAQTEPPAAPAGTGATREGSPGAAGSDAEGGRVATTPGATGTTTPDDGTLSGDRTMGGTSDIKAHESDRVLMGKVESLSGRSLSIQSDMGDSRTLEIVPETIITVDGREGSSSDIREGQPIRASFNEQDGKQVAVKIEAGEMMGGHGDMGTTGTGSGADTAPHGDTTGTSPADTGTSTSGSGTDTDTRR
jgi:hypothetical protein